MTPEDYWEMQWGKLSVRNRVLDRENARLREALRTIRNVSHLDSSCNPQSATCTEIEKQWAALEENENGDKA